MLAYITACVCIGCICVVCGVTAQDTSDFEIPLEKCNSSSCSSSKISNVTASSDIGCITKCVQSRDFECKSISFDEQTGVCQLRDGQDGQFVRKPAFNAATTPIIVKRGSRTFRAIQQRLKGHIDFKRNWTEYERGFGDIDDFWIGLKAINELTATPKLLRVEMTRWSGSVYVAEYGTFKVEGASNKYRMTFVTYNNINMTTNSFYHHSTRQFSTMDADNDDWADVDCAGGTGGWWFGHCSYCNPNGIYNETVLNRHKRMYWKGAGESEEPLKHTRLMLLLV